MTLLRLCRLSLASLLPIVLHSLPLGVFVVTVDVDVVVDVDVDCGRCRQKLVAWDHKFLRVVTPQKYNQLIWLSSLQLILYTCDEMTVEQTRYGKLPSNPSVQSVQSVKSVQSVQSVRVHRVCLASP